MNYQQEIVGVTFWWALNIVDWRDWKLIWNLYNKQVAYCDNRTGDGLSTACSNDRR